MKNKLRNLVKSPIDDSESYGAPMQSNAEIDTSSYPQNKSLKLDERDKLILKSKGGKNPALWDRLGWKAVDVDPVHMTGFSGGMFMGLEEVDGSQISIITGNSQKFNKKEDKLEKKDKKQSVKDKSKQGKKKNRADSETAAGEMPTLSAKKDEKDLTIDSSTANSSVDDATSSLEVTKMDKLSNDTTTNGKKRKRDDNVNNHRKKQQKTEPTSQTKQIKTYLPLSNETQSWGNIQISSELSNAMKALSFESPTPIQSSSVPVTMKGSSDVIGIAETGSGKTIAFALPMLNTLLSEWEVYGRSPVPMALVIAPTRELVMQIAMVLNDISNQLKDYCKIEVVTVIGGMSEQKQKRLLSNTTKRPAHIIVATPGRLHELVFESNGDIPMFEDMSKLRYLVVDEVDRIMEEGHFAELHRIFSRIREHEKLCDQGKSPAEEIWKQQFGEDFVDDADKMDQEKENDETDSFILRRDDDDSIHDDIEQHDDDDDLHKEQDQMEKSDKEDDDDINPSFMFGQRPVFQELPGLPTYRPNKRQTLLFSATANQKQMIESKKGKKIRGIGDGAVRQLPRHIQELLALVALKRNTQVIDVTKTIISDGSTDQTSLAPLATLPQSLKQYEIKIDTDDKDLYAYRILLQTIGRTLVFVNSIKTARRLDGLLRALDMNCRTIHAELQQKQRIKALESFQSSPNAILVATDVAARGLDIPKINTVLHYDIARSPQLYVHRSGRTARAQATGITVSIVTPEDSFHHENICKSLGVKKLDTWKMTERIHGRHVNEELLLNRIKLAKKIFTQSFVLSQKSKVDEWIRTNAENTGLDLQDISDDIDNLGRAIVKKPAKKKSAEDTKAMDALAKKEVARLRAELRQLLDIPIDNISGSKFSRPNKPRFVVFVK